MTLEIDIRRVARIPDPARVARHQRAPELGPRILFFSGGSALSKLCRRLKLYTHNSAHLVTAFDSGGSSAELRRAFGMLSLGDLRQRLLSLADETALGNPEIYACFSHRLAAEEQAETLRAELEHMVEGTHSLVRRIPRPLSEIVRTHLRHFHERMPADFDLRNASIGNLVLAGGYLNNHHDIGTVIFLFSKLVEVRGHVRPVVEEDLHLRARLENGEEIAGQHRITGKLVPEITSPIRDVWLTSSPEDPAAVNVRASNETLSWIRNAELICFPMGSFYSSLLVNLLPRGIGRAIAESDCPKIHLPNMGRDPEQLGMSLSGSVARILEAVRRDAGEVTPANRIINAVVIDSQNGQYDLSLDVAHVKQLGVDVLDLPLVRQNGWPWIDGEALAELLLSIA